MSQSVEVPGVGTIEFPDGMSQPDMASAIQKNFPQIHKQEQKAPEMGLGGTVKGVADAALAVGSGVLQQAAGMPKHLAQLSEKLTEPLSRMTPEQKATTAQRESEPGITEKLQGLVSYQPKTDEGKYILGQLQKFLQPVTEAVGEIRKGSEKVIGKEATDVASDVIGLAGLKGAGTASTGARALKAAESTQSKVTRIIDNLGGGKSLEKADVGEAVQKSVGSTVAAAKKTGTSAYEDLSAAMGSDTPVGLVESTKVANELGARVVVDPKIAAFSKKLNSVRAMTFEDLKDLRTQISDSMGTDRNVNRQLRQLRDAVTKDIEAKAETLGPEAKQKWDIANAKWKEYVKTEDRINRVLGKNWAAKTPAEMYQKLLTATTKDPQKVVTIMESIKDLGVKRQFAASVLHHMSDVGGEFSGDKFIGQWSRMNPQARKALFDSVGSNYVQNMDKLVHNLERIREGKTGMIKEVSGIGVAALLGHFIPGGTPVVGAVTLGREAYKFGPKAIEAYLTSPQWVRTLAERTTAALQRGGGAAVVTTQQTPNTLESIKPPQNQRQGLIDRTTQ